MARWLQALLLVALLVQAQVATSPRCECRDGAECGSPTCPVCSAVADASRAARPSCCQGEDDEPGRAPDRTPCDCGRCARAHPVAFPTRVDSTDPSLARRDVSFLPRVDLAAPMPLCIAPSPEASLRVPGLHGPPACPSGASPDLLPVLRL